MPGINGSLLECSRVGKKTKIRELEPPGTLIKPAYLSPWSALNTVAINQSIGLDDATGII